MLPVIAIVGRPNVGKSTLFNQLTRSRQALVADSPGLTRDRQYGEGKVGLRPFIVIDTGGIGEESESIDGHMTAQSTLAIEESDIILFLVDIRAGVTAADERITQLLRQAKKPVYLIANKSDGVDIAVMQAELFQLGLGEPIPIAASHGRGVKSMIESISAEFPAEVERPESTDGIKFAIVGRPNVGKSTLVNRILGEERVVVYDQPGTTRDSIHINFERRDRHYTIIDTAGVRRRGRVKQAIEKFSVVKTLTAIEEADVVILVIDGRETITDQDLHLLGFVLEAGKALLIAVNKWDGLTPEQRERMRVELDRRLVFVNYAERYFISALHGSRVGDLFPALLRAYDSANMALSTAEVNQVLQDAIKKHPPPMVRGRRIKCRYAHAGGRKPPLIVIHGNQLDALPKSYTRFLMNTFREHFKLVGTPIRIELKTSENPYKGRKNVLTDRQKRRRKRLFRHVKKK